MHQRVAVDAFERGARHQGLLAATPNSDGAFHHQERPEALAAAEAGIAHGLEQARRPAELAVERVGAQQPVEQRLGVLRDLIEAVLELAVAFTLVLMVEGPSGRLSIRGAA